MYGVIRSALAVCLVCMQLYVSGCVRVACSMSGCAAGMLPAVCSSLYPAGVRITGICLSFHLGEA
jgi:hypothetical protein